MKGINNLKELIEHCKVLKTLQLQVMQQLFDIEKQKLYLKFQYETMKSLLSDVDIMINHKQYQQYKKVFLCFNRLKIDAKYLYDSDIQKVLCIIKFMKKLKIKDEDEQKNFMLNWIDSSFKWSYSDLVDELNIAIQNTKDINKEVLERKVVLKLLPEDDYLIVKKQWKPEVTKFIDNNLNKINQ